MDALLAGDEQAFRLVFNRYSRPMVRLAMSYVPTRALAEEVVQEAWLAFIRGLAGFKGHSSLKTWLFGILLNRAKTCGHREWRTVAFSEVPWRLGQSSNRGIEDWAGPGGSTPRLDCPVWTRSALGLSPEDKVLSSELRLCVERAITCLPPAQRAVIILRDVEGWSGGEVCDLLGISPENQRVRLHRARRRVRQFIREYLRQC